MYQVPSEYYVRLHHCRPRFKNDIENVLLYMASEICLIGEKTDSKFAEGLNKAIKLYPGNSTKKIKTINNWRTEISALLGLIEYTGHGASKPSKMAEILSEKQDLIEFFRLFSYKFQYPGGHLKPTETLEMIKRGVKFKPAKYLLELLLTATTSKGKFGITKAEATHCIFNDLRVVRDGRPVSDVIDLIEKNRNRNTDYDSSGDVVRYAGDILDYLVLANLLINRPDGKYYIKTTELSVIKSIVDNNEHFPMYDNLYNKYDLELSDINETQTDWFKYFNDGIDGDIFESNIENLIGLSDTKELSIDQETELSFIDELLKSLLDKKEINGSVSTKEIGDIGEAISIHHERNRLSQIGKNALAKKVMKIPENFSAGYDIHSYEGIAETKRYIEVKTTISKNKITINRFHMTPSEWGSAETLGNSYFVYRLMVSGDGVELFVIRDPVGQYKSNNISMSPRSGAEIQFTDKSGNFEEVLV
jgi:hypothetical protein